MPIDWRRVRIGRQLNFWRSAGALDAEELVKMAVGERCPACGAMPADHTGAPTLTWEGQLTAWAVELTRASTTPGQEAADIAARLRILYQALEGLHDGPASDAPAS